MAGMMVVVGGSKIGKFMKQKSPNQLCWLATLQHIRVDNSKTNKAQASRFCSTASGWRGYDDDGDKSANNVDNVNNRIAAEHKVIH